MNNSTSVNKSFPPQEIRDRPLSAAACATFLGVGLWMGHLGLEANLPPELSWPATALFAAVALLQWVAIGRWRTLKTAGADSHASRLACQIGAFALIEVFLYSLGVISAATTGGLAIATGTLAFWGAVAAAAIFTAANIWVKHNSVDAPERDRSPYKRTQSADAILQAKYDGDKPENVYDLTDAIRKREAGEADQIDFLTDKTRTKDRIRVRRKRNGIKDPTRRRKAS